MLSRISKAAEIALDVDEEGQLAVPTIIIASQARKTPNCCPSRFFVSAIFSCYNKDNPEKVVLFQSMT